MQVELKDGYKVNVDENCSNDWNFLVKLRKIEKGDSSLIVDVAETLLGTEEELEKLVKHLEVDGRTSISAMADALAEIMEAAGPVKNS